MLSTSITRSNWLLLLLTTIHFDKILAQDVSPVDSVLIATAATTSSPPPTTLQSSTFVSSAGPATHTVQVGLLDHKMRPETTEAAVGDIVEFDFYPLNHSIVRAEYGFPCIPYEMTGSSKGGFFSGFNPVDKVLENPPKYSIRINNTEPIFFYCSAPGSCITYGMVGGINLNGSMSIDKQRTLAMDSAYMLQPGEPFPVESLLPSGNPASSVIPSSSVSSSLGPAAGASHSLGGISTGAIVGIVVASVISILFGALLFFCWGRMKSLHEAIERKDGTVRRISASPNQMVEYERPNITHNAHSGSQLGFQFPPHPTVHPSSHPSSLDMGVYGHQLNRSMGANYLPGSLTAKYASPTATYPAYHTVSPGSPPLGTMGLNGHTFMHQELHDASRRGGDIPAPGYYEILSPGQPQAQERAVEMEAITAVNQADEGDLRRASKF